ncbi:ABC transporter ATP-binding protein [Bacillus sp. DX1.1]|uniref:ABC transporter ATP-binding protein n=1 Tax=unclassified Bacillus (in: firmicutes) TaxID=185979 RepID=UPI002570BE7A|nr:MULTISPECIES: ABC transporter ATP-binding protein [unclassified Bacillus (in: firmicutes)]MDM5153499.1 ABC transporter ATP-binding protein [Bacillus sp. DX1.1]
MNDGIDIKHLVKKIDNHVILDDVSLEIPKGAIYGILGANGAGKTTLMKVILNMLKASSGDITILGQPIDRRNHPVLSEVGCLIETPIFYDHLTAEQNLMIHCQYVHPMFIQNIQETMVLVGLEGKGNHAVHTFSLGMKQRLGIARALVTKPKILVLDEPINGLDPKGIVDMRNLLQDINQKYQTTILISSHIISELDRLATHIAILDQGKVMKEFTMSALRESGVDLEDYFLTMLHA